MLLRREEVTPDKPDNHRRTPLWYTASRGNGGMVKTLLRRGEVNPNRPDSRGQTPLISVPQWGYQKLKTLLQSYEV